MRPLSKGTMRNAVPTVLLGAWIALGTPALVRANVITDWDEKGVAFVTSNIVGPGGTRAMAMVHVAMFDAVNSIERRYRPYLVQLPVDASTSKEAAAAAAAGAVLAGLVPVNSKAWEEMKAATANYLATLPEGEAKLNGIKLGEMVATYIASFSPEMRDETRTILLAFVDEMVPFVVADMISKGQAPAYWMKTDS